MSALPTTTMLSRVSGGVTKVRGSKPNSWEELCFKNSRFTQAVKELVDSDTVGSSTGTRVSRRVQVRKIKVEQEAKAEKITASSTMHGGVCGSLGTLLCIITRRSRLEES